MAEKAWDGKACEVIGHYLITGICVRCGWTPESRTVDTP